MWKPILIIIFLFAALYAGYWYLNRPEVTEFDPAPINTMKVPYQSYLADHFTKSYQIGYLNVVLSPRANYTVYGRILSRRRYSRGWESKISQWDIVFGWGDAAELEKITDLEIRQSVRWYNYRISTKVPMTGHYVATHTSNNHLIPFTENVRRALLFLKQYDVVEMSGYLVDVHGTKGAQNVSWITSMSREDTGDGACEIFLVKSIKVGGKVYK